jgi:phosphatidylethanolamine-binding protein (PEBP) family uncharacterized protein
MRQPLRAIPVVLLLSALALAGCGTSGATPIKVTRIPFKSAAIGGVTMPARYTCDGKNVFPPLEWGSVPPNTRELALLVIGLTPTLAGNSYSVSIDWALAGVNPALHRLAAGQLPPGAHLGSTTDGKTRYSVCPKKGKPEQYQFELYAVPATVTIPAGFTGLEVLSQIGAETSPIRARARGTFDVIYKRK